MVLERRGFSILMVKAKSVHITKVYRRDTANNYFEGDVLLFCFLPTKEIVKIHSNHAMYIVLILIRYF